MRFYKSEFFYPIIGIIASIFFCTIIWDHIALTYSNPHEIVGEYSINSYNSFNDTLRYIIFISIPLLFFFIIFLKTKNVKNFNNLTLKIFLLDTNFYKISYEKKNLILLILISVILFLVSDWTIYPVQIFEDGISLSGSTIFEFKQKPWIDVYINTGFFYDMLNAKISWILTGLKTIGSFKFYIKFLNLISFILLIYFLYEISKQITDEIIKKQFFVFSSISLFFILQDVDIWRDIPIVIFLISILRYINSKSLYSILIISFLSVFTFFWSLDRGFFLFFSLIPFLALVILNNKKEFLKFIITIFLFSLIFIFFLGLNIFNSFIEHTKEIFTQHEMLNGLIHPSPFSDEPNSSRATKSLLVIIFNFIISILIVFSKKNLFFNNTKFIFLFFSITNFLLYKSALSRSDGGHIKMATYFSIILLVIFLIFFILHYLNKQTVFKNNINKLKFLYSFLFLIIFVNYINSFENIYKFPKKLKNYIVADNSFFVDKNYTNSINDLKVYFNNSECVQAFSYDQAIFYFLKKKSCSKFYNVWVIGSKKNQELYINELKSNKPKYILKGGITDFQPLEERYPYIENFIQKEYFLYDEIGLWEILKINNN